MSHIFRRFLSTAVLSALLICSSLTPVTVSAFACTDSGRISGYAVMDSVSETAAFGTNPATDPAAAPVLPEEKAGVSVRDSRSAACVDTDVLQEDRLVSSNGKIRCKLSNGKYLTSSWRTFGRNTYYFNKKTYAVKGLQKIGNSYYIFNSKGVLQKGWIKYKNHWYYGSVNKKGKLLSGWQTIGKKRYYISVKKLYRLTGLQYIGNKHYYFNSKGVRQTINQVVGGKKIVFNADGSVYSYGAKVFGGSGPSQNRKNSGTSKGQQVVNYAVQFVGNPYKWGGSSLTHGADCSGFVMAVYSHFGIRLPHYDAWIRKCGRSVNGLANAQPGDVICYNGHVAIYMGGGRIVHAADYRYGICIWNNAAYRRILSIRRFF